MRIAMLSWESLHSIAVGGVAAHVTELAASLERAGHHVHVFTRQNAGQKHYELIHGVHYHRCPMDLAKDFVDEVNGMCSSFAHHFAGVEDFVGEFDVVHAHDWLAVNAMIWIKQGRGRRGVLTMHSTDYGRSGNVFHGGQSERVRHQERAGTYWADRVIAVSHATRQRTDVDVRGARTTKSTSSTTASACIASKAISIRASSNAAMASGPSIRPSFSAADSCSRRGPTCMLEAIPHVLHHYPNAKFVFAGDGHHAHSLEHRAGNCASTMPCVSSAIATAEN